MERDRGLSALGREVGRAQDRAIALRHEEAESAARAHLVASAVVPARRHVSWLPLAVAGVGVAVAAVLAAAALWRAPWQARLAVAVGGAGWSDAPAADLVVPPGPALPVRFSDGSLVLLAPGTRARVASVDADGARLELVTGELHATVVHRARARWAVVAGGYEVRVVGTRFDVSWEASTGRLGLALHEGAVFASGPLLGEGRTVIAGEVVRAWVPEAHLEISGGDPARFGPDVAHTGPFAPGAGVAGASSGAGGAAAAAAVSAPEDAAPSAPPPVPSTRTAAPVAPAARAGPISGSVAPASGAFPAPAIWRGLLPSGRYADALSAAEAAGFAGLCASAGTDDLLALGDMARLAGSAARAKEAYGAVRARFPRTPAAADAAFMIGRVSLDVEARPAEAARWFGTHLAEAPDGALAREALGRLVEAHVAGEDLEAARAAAAAYLARFPAGPHADLASDVLRD